MGDNHQLNQPGTTPPGTEQANSQGNQPALLTPEQQAAADKAAADKKTADDAAAKKAADEKAAGEFKPIKVEDIKLPEGVELDNDLATGFVDLVNTHKISPELQQALIDLQSKSMQALSAKDSENWTKTQGEWETQIKADPEYGGTKFEATMSNVGKFVNTFGDDAAKEAFDVTGAGNHPAIIKMLAKAAVLITEGTHVPADTPGEGKKDAASILYPNQGKT